MLSPLGEAGAPMDWRYPLANNDDLGGEFNSRMAEEPSLDFRC